MAACNRTNPHPLGECPAYADGAEALVQAIMATHHSLVAQGPQGPWVLELTEGQVRDLVANGKGERTLELCSGPAPQLEPASISALERRLRGLDTPAGAGDDVEAYRG